MKYKVLRNDGRDNSDELYFVIRVDDGAKNVEQNRQGVKEWLQLLPTDIREAIISDNRDLHHWIDEIDGSIEVDPYEFYYIFCKTRNIIPKTREEDYRGHFKKVTKAEEKRSE